MQGWNKSQIKIVELCIQRHLLIVLQGRLKVPTRFYIQASREWKAPPCFSSSSNFTYPPNFHHPSSRHYSRPKKTVLRNMVSLLERNPRWNMVANRIGGASEAHRRRTGGDLKLALAQHWVSESEVWQWLGASLDLLNSRCVPYFPIRSQFWAVRAWKEKYPAFKDIGPPTHFP